MRAQKGGKWCKEIKCLSVSVCISTGEIPAFHLVFFGNKGEVLPKTDIRRKNVRKKNQTDILKKNKSAGSESTWPRLI